MRGSAVTDDPRSCACVVVPDFRAAIISGAVLSVARSSPRAAATSSPVVLSVAQRLPDEDVIYGAKQEHGRASNMPFSRGERPARCCASQCRHGLTGVHAIAENIE